MPRALAGRRKAGAAAVGDDDADVVDADEGVALVKKSLLANQPKLHCLCLNAVGSRLFVTQAVVAVAVAVVVVVAVPWESWKERL